MIAARKLLKGYVIVKEDGYSIEVSTDGNAEQFADILSRLITNGVPITHFTQKLPTLEDVFLTLIGEKKEGNSHE